MGTARNARTSDSRVRTIEDSPIARSLFGNVRWAWIWLVLRLYVGWQWLEAGWGKLQSAAWTGSNAGAAISGFVTAALKKTAGEHPDVQEWYAWFLRTGVLPHVAFWSRLVTYAEVIVGVALILGLYTGVTAFFGSFMSVNYLLAGTVSTNPILFAIATWLVLSWKTAGWWGLDRWVLPVLGTFWSPGLIFQHRDAEVRAIPHRGVA